MKLVSGGFFSFGKKASKFFFWMLFFLFFPFFFFFKIFSFFFFTIHGTIIGVGRHFNRNWVAYVDFLIQAVVAPWFYWKKYEQWKKDFWDITFPRAKNYVFTVVFPYLYRDLLPKVLKSGNLKPAYYDWMDYAYPAIISFVKFYCNRVVYILRFYLVKKTFGFWYLEFVRRFKFLFIPKLQRRFFKLKVYFKFLPRAVVLGLRKGYPFVYFFYFFKKKFFLYKERKNFRSGFSVSGFSNRVKRKGLYSERFRFGCNRLVRLDLFIFDFFFSLASRFSTVVGLRGKFARILGDTQATAVGVGERERLVSKFPDALDFYSAMHRNFFKYTNIRAVNLSIRRRVRRRKRSPLLTKLRRFAEEEGTERGIHAGAW